MPKIPPEIALKAIALKAKYGLVRDATPNFVNKVINEAERYEGCYLGYWQTDKARNLVIYRQDRPPNNIEVYPWIQACFPRIDNEPLNEWAIHNYRFFFDGDVFTESNVADTIGDALTTAADKDSNSDAFDFSKTELGKKLERNGR